MYRQICIISYSSSCSEVGQFTAAATSAAV